MALFFCFHHPLDEFYKNALNNFKFRKNLNCFALEKLFLRQVFHTFTFHTFFHEKPQKNLNTFEIIKKYIKISIKFNLEIVKSSKVSSKIQKKGTKKTEKRSG